MFEATNEEPFHWIKSPALAGATEVKVLEPSDTKKVFAVKPVTIISPLNVASVPSSKITESTNKPFASALKTDPEDNEELILASSFSEPSAPAFQ